MECKSEAMEKKCACTYPCKRRGNCCQCVEYHRAKQEYPGCFFTPEGEKLYDRSWDCLSKHHR